MAKEVAATLTGILDHASMKRIMSREDDIHKDLVPKMLEDWSCDVYTRNPGPAVTENGTFKGTDLDLSCFLQTLCQREAVINLPVYKSRRVATKREGETIISKENRHGAITGLTANKSCFSFGIRIKDMNVVQKDATTGQDIVGAFRNFMLLDLSGEWYEGWRTIQFLPSAQENKFLSDHKLWTDSKVIFKNFVHPNRWASFYGSYYFLTKVLIERLNEEAKFCYAEMSRLQAAKVEYPRTGEGAPQEWPDTETVGKSTPVTFKAFEAEVDVPEFTGAYKSYPSTQEGLVQATQHRKALIYGIIPRLRFAARSVEYAFFSYGYLKSGGMSAYALELKERMPGWIQDARWEREYKEKGARKLWNRLIFTQPSVGAQGVALRYRVWDKVEQVAVESEA